MSNQPGLSDHKRYEAFTGKWRSSVLKEAEKWCSEEQAAQLLAEAVLAEFRNKYADIDPPLNPEYPLRAQVCLVYSQTGPSIRRLSDYLAMQETAAEAYTAQEPPASEAQTPPAVQPEPSPAAQSEAVPAPPLGPAAAPEPVRRQARRRQLPPRKVRPKRKKMRRRIPSLTRYARRSGHRTAAAAATL